MNDLIYDKDSKPNSKEHISNVIVNIFNDFDIELADEDNKMYFAEMFLYFHELFLENSNASLSASFQKENIYNFAKIKEEKKNLLLKHISGISFKVEYKDDVIIRVESCGDFLKSLLRKACEDVELAYVIENDQSFYGDISYVFLLSPDIYTPDAYLEFLNAPADIKVFEKTVKAKIIDKLIQLSIKESGKFTLNIKNIMQQKYNESLLNATKNDDLSDYIRKIYQSAA